MDKTKNQHYVPRMYIKRFGYGTEDNPRISVLKKQEGIILHNQNPENFASKRFFYDTTEDVIEDVLKWDIEAFPSIKESKFYHDEQSHEPPALLVVCCWPYGADVTFPPKGGLTNHCLVTLPPKGGSVSRCLVTGGRLKAALCYLAYSPSIWSRSYCSLMYFLIVSSFTLPTVSQ